MPVNTLSQVQIDSFRDRGFLVVSDLLSTDEVTRIAEAARAEFETHRYMAAKARFPAPTKYVLSEDSLRLPDIRLVVDHPSIVSAVGELLADEVCLSAFVIYSMPPGTQGTGGDYQRTHESAHCDYKPFRPVGSSLRWLFVIVPLVDYTEEVGPLLVSPGSHQIPELTRRGRVTHVRRARADRAARLRRHPPAARPGGVHGHVHLAPGLRQPLGPAPLRGVQQVPRAQRSAGLRSLPVPRQLGRPVRHHRRPAAGQPRFGPDRGNAAAGRRGRALSGRRPERFPAVPRSRVRSARAATRTTSSPSSWMRRSARSAHNRRG